MDIFYLLEIVLVICVTFFNLFLAILVLINNPKSLVNRVFFLIGFFFSIWCGSLFLYEFPFILTSLFWIRITYMSIAITLALMAWFSFIFPTKSPKKLLIPEILGSLFYLTACFWLLYFTKVWVTDVVVGSSRLPQTILGSGYPISIILDWIVVAFTGINFVSKWKNLNKPQRIQVGYFWLGYLLYGIFICIFDGIIPIIFHDTSTFFASSAINLFFTIPVAYIILKHRFFDIKFIVLKFLAYALFILFLGLVYSLGLSLFGSFFNVPINLNGLTLATVVSFTIIFSFLIFQRAFQSVTEKIFYRDRYNPQALIAKIGRIVASSIELSHISEAVIKEFLSQMKLSAGSLAISREGTVSRIRQIGEMENPSDNGQALCEIIERIVRSPGENVLVRDEIAESAEKQLMEKGKYNVILPLIVGDETVGAIILGNKLSGQVYSTEDIEILKILAPQIAAAIKNALSYEQTKEFNLLLQVKVERATENLKHTNEKLKDLDKLKDEFVSITSHELRTPMTVIKSYVWRILNDKKEEELSEKTKQRLQLIYDATEKEIALVNDILDISRIEAGTMILMPEVFDIAKLAEVVKKELSDSFTKKGISLTVQKTTYKVNSDQNNTHQVFTNLLTNALKFTNEGGKVDVKFKKSGKFIETSIFDTGIGIRKSDFPKLFTKFGRLGNVLSPESTVGTGLGLYICKKMVERSGGEISVKSEVGKGSTFIFDLPTAS